MTPLYGQMVRLNDLGPDPRLQGADSWWHHTRWWHLHDRIWAALDRQGR